MSRGYEALHLSFGDDTESLTSMSVLLADIRTAAAAGQTHQAYERLASVVDQVQRAGFDDIALEVIDEFRLAVPTATLNPLDRAWLQNYEGLSLFRLGHLSEAKTAFAAVRAAGASLGNAELTSTALLNLGNVAFMEADYQEARHLYAECAQEKMALKDGWGTVQALLNLANTDQEMGDVEGAEEILAVVEAVVKSSPEPSMKIGLSFHRAAVCVKRGDLDGAENYYRIALGYARRAVDLHTQVQALRNIGNTCLERRQSGRALRWYRRAQAVAEILANPTLSEQVYRSLANAFYRADRLEEAVTSFEHSRIYALASERTHEWATDTANMGAIALRQHKQEGIALLEQALEVFMTSGDREWEERTLSNLLAAYRLSLNPERLVSTAERLLHVLSPQNHHERTRVLRQTAEALTDMPDHVADAASWLTRALDEQKHEDDPAALAWNAALAGALMRDHNQLEQALRFFEQAIPIYTEQNDSHLLFKTRNDRGNVLAEMGRLSEAQAEFEWCLTTGQHLEDRAMELQATLNMGEVLRRQAELEHALSLYERAYELAQEMNDTVELGHVLTGRGLVLTNLGQWQDAGNAYKEAFALSQLAKALDTQAFALRGMGNCHYHYGRFARAVSAYRKAAQLFEKENDLIHLTETLGGLALGLTARNQMLNLEPVIQRLIDLAQRLNIVEIALQTLFSCAEWTLYRDQREETADIYVAYLVLCCLPLLDESEDESEQEELKSNEPVEQLLRLVLQSQSYLEDGDPLWSTIAERLQKQHNEYGDMIAYLIGVARQAVDDAQEQFNQKQDNYLLKPT